MRGDDLTRGLFDPPAEAHHGDLVRRRNGQVSGGRGVGPRSGISPVDAADPRRWPDDELDDLDEMHLRCKSVGSDNRPPCEMRDPEASYCDGYAHLHRRFNRKLWRWSWAVFELCPKHEGWKVSDEQKCRAEAARKEESRWR